MTTPAPRQRKSLFERVGITARDVIFIVFIIANTYLLMNGHQQLDANILRVQAVASAAAKQCNAVAQLP